MQLPSVHNGNSLSCLNHAWNEANWASMSEPHLIVLMCYPLAVHAQVVLISDSIPSIWLMNVQHLKITHNIIQLGLVLKGMWCDGRRNALTRKNPKKIQTCRRQNQRATNKPREEGLKSYVDMTIYARPSQTNNVPPQTFHNLTTTQQLILSLVAKMHAVCSCSPNNVLHSPSTYFLEGSLCFLT